jgi:histone H3/H4
LKVVELEPTRVDATGILRMKVKCFETPDIIEGFVCLRGNMGALHFHRMPRYSDHVEQMRNQVVHDLPMNHEYSEHVGIVHVNELMPLLDAAPAHNDDEQLLISLGPKPKRNIAAPVTHIGPAKDYQSDRMQMCFFISLLRFVRVVRGIMEDIGQYRFKCQYAATQLLQLVAETHVAQSFADGLLLAYHAKRITVKVDDTRLARRLRSGCV